MDRTIRTYDKQADHMTQGHPRFGQIYTTAEVAKLLRVSQRTVQNWVRDGMLTAVCFGRILRIRQTDLEMFGEVVNRRNGHGRSDDDQ